MQITSSNWKQKAHVRHGNNYCLLHPFQCFMVHAGKLMYDQTESSTWMTVDFERTNRGQLFGAEMKIETGKNISTCGGGGVGSTHQVVSVDQSTSFASAWRRMGMKRNSPNQITSSILLEQSTNSLSIFRAGARADKCVKTWTYHATHFAWIKMLSQIPIMALVSAAVAALSVGQNTTIHRVERKRFKPNRAVFFCVCSNETTLRPNLFVDISNQYRNTFITGSCHFSLPLTKV